MIQWLYRTLFLSKQEGHLYSLISESPLIKVDNVEGLPIYSLDTPENIQVILKPKDSEAVTLIEALLEFKSRG